MSSSCSYTTGRGGHTQLVQLEQDTYLEMHYSSYLDEWDWVSCVCLGVVLSLGSSAETFFWWKWLSSCCNHFEQIAFTGRGWGGQWSCAKYSRGVSNTLFGRLTKAVSASLLFVFIHGGVQCKNKGMLALRCTIYFRSTLCELFSCFKKTACLGPL